MILRQIQKIRFAFENIETYSWSMHRVHAKEAELERKKNEEKKGLFSRIGQAFASLFQRKDEEDQKNAADDDKKEDPAEFQLNFQISIWYGNMGIRTMVQGVFTSGKQKMAFTSGRLENI